MITLFAIAQLNVSKNHFIADDINYQLNCSVYVVIGRHCCDKLIKIHIHLIAFDRQVYREVKLIAVTLMTSCKPVHFS